MGFGQAIKSCFSKYVTFSGRAARSEFWYFALFTFIGTIAISLIERLTFGISLVASGLLEGMFSLVTFLPSISVSVRRLHDLDRSGWWWWLWLIPIVGWIVLIIWMATKGTEGQNSRGSDPLDDDYDSPNDDGELYKSSIPSVSRKDEINN